jgi:hypothetical protein
LGVRARRNIDTDAGFRATRGPGMTNQDWLLRNDESHWFSASAEMKIATVAEPRHARDPRIMQ